MDLWDIVGAILTGLVIGVLARIVLRGRQDIGILMTILLGIAGAFAGSWLWTVVFGGGDTPGIDWIALGLGVLVAAVLIAIYSAIRSGSRST